MAHFTFWNAEAEGEIAEAEGEVAGVPVKPV